MSFHTAPSWTYTTLYNSLGFLVYDQFEGSFWRVAVSHTSASFGTFAQDRAAHPTFWTQQIPQPPPPIPTAPERDRYAQWDQPAPGIAPVRNTMWVSIGMTGFAHAPIARWSRSRPGPTSSCLRHITYERRVNV
jgi:hypothetical protein